MPMAFDVLHCKSHEALKGEVAEDSFVEWCLVLVDSAAVAGGGVGPVYLVGLSNLHPLAIVPVVGPRELSIGGVIVVTGEAILNLVHDIYVFSTCC